MKRKIAFALVSIAAVGGTWSCLTWGQDPLGPARGTRPPVLRTYILNGKSVTYAESNGELDIVGGNIGSNDGPNGLALNVNHSGDNVATLAGQLKSAEGAEKESVLAKLKSEVGQQFDRRQDAKGMDLKALEEQLAKLKEIHNKRTQQRDQIIAFRVQQIVRDVEGLGWGTDLTDLSRLRTTHSSDDLFLAPPAPPTVWAMPAEATGFPLQPIRIRP